MKSISGSLDEMLNSVPKEIQEEVKLQFEISARVNELMNARGLTKRQLATALNRQPSEITKWLSGQHNFTLRTLAMLSAYFNEPIIRVVKEERGS